MNTDCEFSPCRKYRWRLNRIWQPEKGVVNFCMLNPSIADENRNDPTVATTIQLADRWGFGGVVVTNIFAWRATDPKDMRAAAEPIGAENNKHIQQVARSAKLVMIAWGAHGHYLNRGEQVLDGPLHGLKTYCLGWTESGQPRHPLFVKRDKLPIRYRRRLLV